MQYDEDDKTDDNEDDAAMIEDISNKLWDNRMLSHPKAKFILSKGFLNLRR